MPIDYRVDAQAGRIHVTCVGNVTPREVLAYFDKLEGDPECPARVDALVDLRGVTSLPESRQLRAMSARIAGARRIAFGLCAIAASSDVMFGIARMFAVYAEAYFEQIQVFRALAEGDAWLDRARRTPTQAG
jgi:hypothetical protein